jgi:hypothetical protein
VQVPPFDGARIPPPSSTVQCVVVTRDRLGIELAPSLQEMLAGYGMGPMVMVPDAGVWTGSAFFHELVGFAPPPLLGRDISASQGLVLKCRLNNRKRISSGLVMQKIGKAIELKRKRRLPWSDGED